METAETRLLNSGHADEIAAILASPAFAMAAHAAMLKYIDGLRDAQPAINGLCMRGAREYLAVLGSIVPRPSKGETSIKPSFNPRI